VAVIHLGVFIVHVAESRGRKGLVSVLRGKCLCNVNSETDCRRRRRRVLASHSRSRRKEVKEKQKVIG
jgi:adenosine/AMP kinase